MADQSNGASTEVIDRGVQQGVVRPVRAGKVALRKRIATRLAKELELDQRIRQLSETAAEKPLRIDTARPVPAPEREAIEEIAPISSPTWPILVGLLLVFTVAAGKPLLPEFAKESAEAYWAEIVPLFLAELGVALMVAYFIGLTIDSEVRRREERQRRRERALELEQQARREAEAIDREQRMVQDVFVGVLGIRHSTPYVRKVVETNLEQRVVRESVGLIYTLRHLTEEERRRISDGRFLILDQTVSFAFENLSSDDVDLPVRFVVPVRQGEKLRSISRLISVVIDDEPVEIVEPPDAPASDCKQYSWTRKLRGGAKMSIVANAIVVKEESDTEVWCSYYPCTRGMSLQVTAPPELNLGIRNNTASKHIVAKNPEHTGTGLWKIDGPILPNDSLVFFWRTDRDEGRPSDEQRDSTAPAARAPG